jgi:hypothetical protein
MVSYRWSSERVSQAGGILNKDYGSAKRRWAKDFGSSYWPCEGLRTGSTTMAGRVAAGARQGRVEHHYQESPASGPGRRGEGKEEHGADESGERGRGGGGCRHVVGLPFRRGTIRAVKVQGGTRQQQKALRRSLPRFACYVFRAQCWGWRRHFETSCFWATLLGLECGLTGRPARYSGKAAWTNAGGAASPRRQETNVGARGVRGSTGGECLWGTVDPEWARGHRYGTRSAS